MIYKLHIPQCAIWSKGPQIPSTMRKLAIERRSGPHEIGVMFPTHQGLAKVPQAMARMRLVGKAAFTVLEEQWPRFHYSLIGPQLYLTDGTTLLVTGRTRDNKDTIAATWDYFEPYLAVIQRLADIRRLLEELPTEVSYSLVSRLEAPLLPPPQLLLTDVIGVGMAHPVMALGGCGGSSPIALCVGTQDTHVVFDHRLYDPQDEQVFVEKYNESLLKHLPYREVY